MSIHKHVKTLKADLVSRGGGDMVSIMDDGYVMGKPEDVYWAVGRFKTAIKKELDCDLQLPKCQIYRPDGPSRGHPNRERRRRGPRGGSYY